MAFDVAGSSPRRKCSEISPPSNVVAPNAVGGLDGITLRAPFTVAAWPSQAISRTEEAPPG